MKPKVKLRASFAVITAIFGFMLAIQFQSIKEPVVRETRDIWQIQEDLSKEQQLQLELLAEIRKYEQLIKNYEDEVSDSSETALNETLNQLKEDAGLSEVSGKGIVIKIKPLMKEELLGAELENVSPDLIKRLINELNSYEADHISINGRRLVNTSVIRDINQITKIDGYSLNTYPIEIKVIGKDPEKLYNRMSASTIGDLFALDNLVLDITQPDENLIIPAYDESIRVKHLKPVKTEKGGES
ncbi:DUF881 domain-containing protein [Metabacillus arenae]|uniref:DUF881 domain-containing protein n=1 Tax=Metabacillus arenae TaxID=2771434 RepID=A0A926RXA8_9BACI|nr:DUF881 domain-containing protein [Metabacillus arenae]MBD1379937.1 DUF881 domain-containing protein [Metabacillus arenae]